MKKKIIYITLCLIAFTLLSGFNVQRIPQWFKAQWDYYAGKYVSASTEYNAASAGETDSVMQFNEGASQYRDGAFEKSEELFTKSTESDPEFADGFYNQGNARFKQDNLEGAVESYENALKIDPEHEDARYNLEYVKKLLQQKTNSPDNADSSEDQRSQNAQSSEKETKEERNTKPDDQMKGKSDENYQQQGDEDEGIGDSGKPQDSDQEKKGGGGGGNEQTEEQPPQDIENKSNSSGMTDEMIDQLLQSLAEEEKELQRQMESRPNESNDGFNSAFGLFEDLWSLQEDLDPYAVQKHKKRQKDEIDW